MTPETGSTQLTTARELSGLDALEQQRGGEPSVLSRLWSMLWPKVVAVSIALLLWQVVVWSGWRPRCAGPPSASAS